MKKALWPPPAPPEGPPNRTYKDYFGIMVETQESKDRTEAYGNRIQLTGVVLAPWTDRQVKSLDRRQQNEYCHPYTCTCGDVYKPTNDGWVCPSCKFTQIWCHASDAGEE